MRKLLFLLAMIIASHLNVFAQTPNPVPLKVIRTTNPNGNKPKSPVIAPTVYIDGYALTFDTPCDGCTLQLVDEDNDVVYSIVIPVGTTTLYLPSYLEGTFELQIIDGDWLFYGEIEL